MITETFFKEKMKNAYTLLGIDYGPGKQEATAKAILGKIQNFYTDKDLEQAIDEIVEKNTQKLNFPVIVQHLRKYKAIRVDAEIQREKQQYSAAVFDADPGISKLINALITKDATVLSEFKIDLGKPFLKNNAVIIGKDGKTRNVYIDYNQAGIEKGFTTVREIGEGGGMVYRAHINTQIVKCVEVVDIDEQSGWEH